MEPAFTVQTRDGVDVRNAMVIVGCSGGTGLVGATTVKHIIGQLKMDCIGSVRADHTPAVAIVRDGLATDPMRIYAVSGVNVVTVQADRLVIVDIERPPEPAEERPLGSAIVAWAKRAGARVVIVPGGIAVDDEALDDKVWGVASAPSGVALLDGMGVDRFGGVIGGLAAAVLNAAQSEGIDALCFLAEAAPGFPDAHAAARIVKLLDGMTLTFALGAEPLHEQAEKVEAEIRASMDLLKAERGHTASRGRKG